MRCFFYAEDKGAWVLHAFLVVVLLGQLRQDVCPVLRAALGFVSALFMAAIPRRQDPSIAHARTRFARALFFSCWVFDAPCFLLSAPESSISSLDRASQYPPSAA